MPIPRFLTIAEQVADHLRSELLGGRWSGELPGVNQLAPELGINAKTVVAALRMLEKEGVLENLGAGKRRRIALPAGGAAPALRVGILDYEPPEKTEEWSILMQKLLVEAGQQAFFAEKSSMELGMDVGRIAGLVERTEADAWVVCSGSREVLAWFAQRAKPTFALFGRRQGLAIAGVGPDHPRAWRAAARRLIGLGHQRIVLLERHSRRVGGPGAPERAVLEEMAAHGIPTSRYNLPDWEDTSKGFEQILEELFRVTPPTALILDEAFLFHAAKEHLAQHGIVAPKHVSLVCIDPDRTFEWCRPSVAHIRWDHRPVVRRVVRWADNIARGRVDRRQGFTKAEYVDGGTVGPVPAAQNEE